MEGKTELQRNAILQARKFELARDQRELDIKWFNNRMDDGRMAQCLALVEEEAAMEKEYQERTDHAALVDAKARKEIDIAFEVAKVKREEVRHFQRRHLLRRNEDSLRTLARKIQSGYVCRDLQRQIKNNECRRLREKEADRLAGEALDKVIYSDQEALVNEDNAKREQCFKYGQELRQQLVSRQFQKQCQYEDSLIEKKMLEDIMRTIADEDQRELQMKRDATVKSRQEMQMFAAAKKMWNDKHKIHVIKEEKEIEKQKQAQGDRDKAVAAERKRREEEKFKISEIISNKIMEDEDKRQRRDATILLLREQELLEKNMNDDAANKYKLVQTKQDTKESLLKQMEYKKQQEREMFETEKRYLTEVREKLKIDEEKDKEKNALKRAKNRTHNEALLKQIESNQRKREIERENDVARAVAVKEYEKAWMKEANAERKEIFKHHVPHLVGFLQAGVMKEEDLPLIKKAAKDIPELAGVNIDALTVTGRRKIFPKCNEQCRVLRQY